MTQVPEDYEPKIGNILVVEGLNVEEGEIVYQEELEVVEGKGESALALRSRSAPERVTASKKTKKDKDKKDKKGSGSPELEVAKFAWEFIKDNKPVSERTGASTSVLYQGTDGLDYHGAHRFQSDVYQYRIRDRTIKSWVLVSADLRLEGTYRARPSRRDDIPDGHYLPSVYFNVLSMNVPWSFGLSASADIAPASNVGTADLVQPHIAITAKLDMTWIFQNQAISIGFEADGLRGGVLGYFGALSRPVDGGVRGDGVIVTR